MSKSQNENNENAGYSIMQVAIQLMVDKHYNYHE